MEKLRFVAIAAGAAIAFIPLPGAAHIGIGLMIKGASDAATAIAEREIKNKDSSPVIGVSTQVDF